MSALGAIAFLFVFMALVCWACVAVGTRHDAPEPTEEYKPEPSEPRPIRPSVDHYDLNMETGDVTYHVVVTNGDRIRSMTDEELALWIKSTACDAVLSGAKTADYWLDWLRTEA